MIKNLYKYLSHIKLNNYLIGKVNNIINKLNKKYSCKTGFNIKNPNNILEFIYYLTKFNIIDSTKLNCSSYFS